MRRFEIIIALFLIVVIAAAVCAQPPRRQPPGPPPGAGIDRPPMSESDDPGGPPQSPGPGMERGRFRPHRPFREDAGFRRPGPPHDPGGGFDRIGRALGLNEEQIQKMQALNVEFSNKTRNARMTLMSLEDERATLLAAGKIDQPKLAEIDEKIIKARADIMREQYRIRRDRLAILNEEQLKRVSKFLAGRQHGMMLIGPGAETRGPLGDWF